MECDKTFSNSIDSQASLAVTRSRQAGRLVTKGRGLSDSTQKYFRSTRVLALTGIFMLSGTGCGVLNSKPDPVKDNSSLTRADYRTDREDRLYRHPYAAIGFGVSHLQPDTSEVRNVDVDEPDNPAGQITVGVDLNRHLALELHSADLGSAGLSPEGRVNYHTYGASALYYMGKNRDRFKRQGLLAYGRIGYGVMENRSIGPVDYDQTNKNHVLFGAGLEYMTRLGLGVRAELISFDEDAAYGQLGVIYRLGKKPRRTRNALAETVTDEIAPLPAVTAAAVVTDTDALAPEPVGDIVYFHFDSADLTGEAREKLAGIAGSLKQFDEVTLSLSAHTDSTGTGIYNQALSERRAASVISYLNALGIEAHRIRSEAFGETQAARSNSTVDGRRLNRRVELHTRD